MSGHGGGDRTFEHRPQTKQPVKNVIPFNQRHSTVYLRFPFARAGFQDPPIDQWTPEKQRALWRRLSSAESRSEIDWEKLSAELHVSVPFILQQAAWLYQLELDQLRQEMGRVQKWKRSNNEGLDTGVQGINISAPPSNHPSPQPQDPGKDSNQFYAPQVVGSQGALKISPTSSESPVSSKANSNSSSRRLLSMSRVLDGHGDAPSGGRRHPIMSDIESSDSDLETNGNKWELTSNFTDISQGSISKSALEEALYDLSDTSSHV